MKEIKFRAFDGNQWSYFTIGQTMTAWMQAVYDDHCLHGRQFFQYTGLKDKNGKEIYESDVIKWTSIHGDSPKERIDTMRWENDYACFMLMPFVHKPHAAVMEVIGNIYENPELLTPTP